MKKIVFLRILAVFFFSAAVATVALVAPAFSVEDVNLGAIVITGARMEQQSGQYGANVTVLGQKEISESGATDTVELLSSAGGVFLTSKSTAKTSVADIRGFGDTADRNVLILLNGRKMNSVDNSGVDLSAISLEAIERVEIVRGAGSVLYGDHAVGGVINIITKKGKGPAHGSVGTTFGSYGARKAFMNANGSAKKVSYFLSASFGEDKGYRSNSDVSTKNLDTRVSYEASDRLSVDVDLRWHEDHYDLPGGLNDAGLTTYGRRGSDEEENYGDTTDRMIGFLTTICPWEDPAIDGELSVDYSFRNQDTYGWYDYGIWGAAATKREIDTHALLTKYVHKGTVSDRHWNAVMGVDLYDVTNDILGSGEGISISTDDLTISKKESGLYAYGELEVLPKVFAGTGLRYQRADYTFDQRSGTPAYKGRDPGETVKKGLIRYEYSKGSNVYVSAEETFRFLSTDEWFNTWTGLDTTLNHQTGIQYEVGWKHDFDGKVQTSIVPYWIENQNEIFVDPSVSPGYNKNYDETLRRGVELSGNFDLKKIWGINRLKEFRLRADYNYQKAVFRDGSYTGNDVPMAPRNQAGLGLSAKWKNGFGLSLSETMAGSRYVINDTVNGAGKEKTYFRTDLKLFFEKENWEVFASVNNLFGKKYNDYAARSTGGSTNIEYYPAPEQNFEVGMKVKF